VTWLNDLSVAEGLTPCYTLTGCTGTDIATGCTPPSTPGSTRGCLGNYQCTGVAFVGYECDGYRLPTEAEWEHFACAGSGLDYHWGPWSNTPGEAEAAGAQYMWYTANSDNHTHPVAAREPSAFGLFDTAGNVSEWVWDWRAAGTDYNSYVNSPDPVGPDTGSSRVVRGGQFDGSGNFVRCTRRTSGSPRSRAFTIGFRPVRTLIGAGPDPDVVDCVTLECDL
jgi:hypothetical protein